MAQAKLTYSRNLYQPEALQSLTEGQLRKEYSRLRSIARKRLERMDNTEWESTQVYRYNRKKFVPLKEVKSERDLRHLLSDVARYVASDRSTITDLKKERKQAVSTLNERGYEFVTEKNYRKFADFMEYARTANIGRLRDSDRVAQFYEFAEKKKLQGKELADAFRSWSKNQRKLDKVQNINKKGSNQYRKAVE